MSQKYKVTLPHPSGGFVNITVPDDLEFNLGSLNKDLGEQPGWFAHYGLIATHCAALRDQRSQALKDTMAAVEIDIRAEVAKTGEKSTEDKIRARVQLHEDVINSRAALAAAEKTASEASIIKEAWYHRKDAMIALAANYRSELSQRNSA